MQLSFRSIHGVAGLLRTLWACIRWDDMNTKPPAGGSNVSTNDTDITTREILEKRDLGPNKLQSQYKVRTIVIPFNFMEQPTRIGNGYELNIISPSTLNENWHECMMSVNLSTQTIM